MKKINVKNITKRGAMKRYCPHGTKSSYSCKQCKHEGIDGRGICNHDKLKSRCRECGGGALCIHDKQKSHCRECGGSAYCIHDKQKTKCRECGGSALCIHDKQKYMCVDCNCAEELLLRKKTCVICVKPNRSSLDKQNVCFSCRNTAGEMRTLRQDEVLSNILPRLPPPSSIDNKMVGGDSCDTGVRRPDTSWVIKDSNEKKGGRIVILEIDEYSHSSRIPDCENAKLYDTRWGAENGELPVVFIRFNPDKMDDVENVSIEKRYEAVIIEITYWLSCPIEEFYPYEAAHVVYMFYGSKGQKHIDAASQATLTICIHEPKHNK